MTLNAEAYFICDQHRIIQNLIKGTRGSCQTIGIAELFISAHATYIFLWWKPAYPPTPIELHSSMFWSARPKVGILKIMCVRYDNGGKYMRFYRFFSYYGGLREYFITLVVFFSKKLFVTNYNVWPTRREMWVTSQIIQLISVTFLLTYVIL